MPNLFRLRTACLIAAFFFAGTFTAQTAPTQNPTEQARFTIRFQGITTDLPVMSAMVMPGDTLSITTTANAVTQSGKLRKGQAGWDWTAPNKPGRYDISFLQNNQIIVLNVFVLTPFENGKETSLNGYRIGQYRKTLFRGLDNYAAPQGFIDLSHSPDDLKISPHFTLKQFICKQQPGHDPTYLLINPRTLIKLETLLKAAGDKGWKADTLHVMSGFRTPHYNAAIGNKTTSSRHLYGGAADVWIDSNGDGQMDDLNRDGKINRDDARLFAKWAEDLAGKQGHHWSFGGLGVYGSNAAHGPFVHIDSRGYKARWGH